MTGPSAPLKRNWHARHRRPLPAAPSFTSAPAEAAGLDASAACEVPAHPVARAVLGTEQAASPSAVVTNAGLGAGALPAAHQRALSESVALGDAELRRLLRDGQAAPRNPPEEVPQPT
ncbi:hypothetical protein GCM10023329_41970 [Streptomyces sanyensis]|uniref:Uncharacterized protein n=1 Tax=Streptomyces sanyensis TaxID=568869 RepID=A0ABP9AV53_9ACTN